MGNSRRGEFQGERRGRQTGGEFEEDLFGRFRPSTEYAKMAEKWMKSGRFIAKDEMMDLIRQYPSVDQRPTSPVKPFARALRLEVIRLLGIPKEEEQNVRFYTCVKTAADIHEGIDAWIEVVQKDMSTKIVTLDATLRTDHSGKSKADLIITDVPDPTENPGLFNDQVKYQARRIASYMGVDVQRKSDSFSTRRRIIVNKKFV